MKKKLMIVAPVALMIPVAAFAFDLPSEPNSAIQTAIDLITTGQYGRAVLDLIDIVGKIAVVLTAAAFSLESFCRACGSALNKAGLTSLADKIHKFSDIVTPWIKYCSLYNTQHGQLVNPLKAFKKN